MTRSPQSCRRRAIRRLSRVEQLEPRQLLASTVLPVTVAIPNSISPGALDVGIYDTRISKSSPTTNYGSASTLRADRSNAMLMKWDLSGIPIGSKIQSVVISVYVSSPTAQVYELYKLNRNWVESQATWNTYAVGKNWQVPGAQGATDHGSIVLATVTAPSTGLKAFALNSAGLAVVQSWINYPATNYGFLLQDYANADNVLFSSGEAATASIRPKIQVTYAPPVLNRPPVVNAGADQKIIYPAAVTLNGTVSDDKLPNGTLTYRWAKIAGPGTVTFGNAAAEDTTARFSASGAYTLRLTASDGVLSASDDLVVTVLVNRRPVVNAGSDQAVVVSGSVALDGSVTDDGLPSGTLVRRWLKVAGPGVVTFANAAAEDTTARFSQVGVYTLRLTANDGALIGIDDVVITVRPNLPGGMWISHDQLMALPASGPAWDALVSAAWASTDPPHLGDPNDSSDVATLAKALVGVRLSDPYLIAQARANIAAAIGTEVGGSVLALGRNLAPYVISAELVGLDPIQDARFCAWLRTVRTEVMSDDRTLQTSNEERPNNWGTMAGASRTAIALYLGDQAELARTAQVFRGWIGDRSAYAGFTYGTDLSWQADPASPVGINPAGSMKNGYSIDGALPEEMRRGGVFQWPAVYTNYPWEALQGAATQAELLYHAGYDAWQWQDQALLRAVRFLYEIGWPATGDDQWVAWLIDARYGTSFAATPESQPGKIMGWTAWTHQPVNPASTAVVASPSSLPSPGTARATDIALAMLWQDGRNRRAGDCESTVKADSDEPAARTAVIDLTMGDS